MYIFYNLQFFFSKNKCPIFIIVLSKTAALNSDPEIVCFQNVDTAPVEREDRIGSCPGYPDFWDSVPSTGLILI